MSQIGSEECNFPSLHSSFQIILHPHTSWKFLKIAWSRFTFCFMHSGRLEVRFGVGRTPEGKKCKMQHFADEENFRAVKTPEKQKYLRDLNGFSRDNEWVSQHMCVRPQKSFLSYTLLTGASRARLSRGPLYLYVLWLEIMHGGVLA